MAPPPHVQALCIILAGVHELLSCSKMKILISNCIIHVTGFVLFNMVSCSWGMSFKLDREEWQWGHLRCKEMLSLVQFCKFSSANLGWSWDLLLLHGLHISWRWTSCKYSFWFWQQFCREPRGFLMQCKNIFRNYLGETTPQTEIEHVMIETLIRKMIWLSWSILSENLRIQCDKTHNLVHGEAFRV